MSDPRQNAEHDEDTKTRYIPLLRAFTLFHARQIDGIPALTPPSAVCLRNAAEPNRRAPILALCEPTRSPDACMTARPAWSRAAANARAMLAEKHLSPLQRGALVQDLRRIETVLEGIPPTRRADQQHGSLATAAPSRRRATPACGGACNGRPGCATAVAVLRFAAALRVRARSWPSPKGLRCRG